MNSFLVQKSSIFSKEFEFTEISGARALPRALRAQKILAFEQKTMKNAIFVIFVARSARAQVRACQFFFRFQLEEVGVPQLQCADPTVCGRVDPQLRKHFGPGGSQHHNPAHFCLAALFLPQAMRPKQGQPRMDSKVCAKLCSFQHHTVPILANLPLQDTS